MGWSAGRVAGWENDRRGARLRKDQEDGQRRPSLQCLMLPLGLAVACLAVACLAGNGNAADRYEPSFFAFQNGVRLKTAQQRVQVLKELGYNGIGSANLNDLVERWKLYERAGLKIFSIYSGINLVPGGVKVPPALPKAIEQLKGRGTMIELFVGGRGSDEQAVAGVRQVADQAAAAGLRVVLYPHTGCHVDTLDDAVRVAKLAQRKNVGVMFNLCHYLMVEPETKLKPALKRAGPLLWRVSICGAESGTRSFKTLIQPLDRGSYDQAELLSLLREVDFDGAIGLQCYGVPGDPRANLGRSIQAWRKIIDQVND